MLDGVLDYPPEVVLAAIQSWKIRVKWDKNIQEHSFVAGDTWTGYERIIGRAPFFGI